MLAETLSLGTAVRHSVMDVEGLGCLHRCARGDGQGSMSPIDMEHVQGGHAQEVELAATNSRQAHDFNIQPVPDHSRNM